MSEQPTDPPSWPDPSHGGLPPQPSVQPGAGTGPMPGPNQYAAPTNPYSPPAAGYEQTGVPAGAAGLGGAAPTGASAGGFFGALFDLSFSRFITPMIIKLVYVLMMIVIAIVYLFYAVVFFQADTASLGVLWLLVIGPIASVLWLAIARMTLEFYLAVVRVSEDVHRAVGAGRR